MTDGKHSMQADGSGTETRPVDGNGEVASRRGEAQAGESGGGPYPNPREGKDESGFGGFTGHGGQSEQGYHGPGQLGGKKVTSGDQPNAAKEG